MGLQLVISRAGLERVLREVLGNSKKFHPRNDPHVEVSLSLSHSHLAVLRVADDGLILSAEELERVWLPYYQIEKNVTGEVEGLGMGLARVASLLWSVGGTWSLCNRDPGPGVVVELGVPLAANSL